MPSAARPKVPATAQKGSSELALIERIRLRAAANQGQKNNLRLGIGDDCAILAPPPGHELLVTTDFSLEGRHFRRDWHSASSAGHRTLARGLSDLAAMGAHPLAAFLSLAVPKSLARNTVWLDGFLDGLVALARAHGVPLAGGDTAESPSQTTENIDPANHKKTRHRPEGPVLADIVLLGSAPAGRALRRSGARPGDRIFCTGSLGGAAAELVALAASPRRFRSVRPDGDHPHLFPQPRVAVGEALLRRSLASACIDLSDGLSTDLAHLCDQSTISAKIPIAAEVYAAALPLHPLAQAFGPERSLHAAGQAPGQAALNAALHGGEDYELLFTAPLNVRVPRSLAGVRLTEIGRILRRRKDQPQVTLIDSHNGPHGRRSALEPQGWEHLR